ncbi:MAG: hypothetical protein AAFV31_18555 [Pseudomonadota bacterium]
MTDKTTLDQKLERLAASGLAPGGAHTLSGNADDILRRILRQIDDIVLPRSLRLESAGRRVVTCDVTARRLVRVAGLGGAVAGVEGQTLGDDTMHEPLRAYFEALVASGAPLQATVTELDRAVEAGEMGVSARALADAWGLPLEPRALLTGDRLIETLVNGLGDAVLAWRSDGATHQSGGSDELAQDLTALPLGPDTPLLPPGISPVMTTITLADGEVAICTARAADTTLALSVKAAAANDVLRLWRQLTG